MDFTDVGACPREWKPLSVANAARYSGSTKIHRILIIKNSTLLFLIQSRRLFVVTGSNSASAGDSAPLDDEIYRELVHHSTDELYIIDPSSGEIKDVNRTACEQLGYDREALTGMRIHDIDASGVTEEWTDSSWIEDQDLDEPIELRHRRRDGSTYPVSVSASLTTISPGRTCLFAIARDITERQAQQRAIEQMRDRFQTIFERSNDAILIVDPEEDSILEANKRSVDLLGYSKDELREIGPSEIHPHELQALNEFFNDIIENEEGYTDSLTCRRKSGERIPAEISASKITLDGQAYILAIIRDMRELRERERELERQNKRLEEFNRVVSHDLRNPLNIALGSIDEISEETESESVERARSALERMEALITDLLEYAKRGQESIDITDVDLAQIVQGCWDNVDTADATIVTNTDAIIRADRAQLQQLFENLIRNAIEHGGEDVTVTVGDLENGFFVEDDGPGIPPEHREDIFESGFSTASSGTGFGLSIASEIAEAHDWSISLGDSPTGGARFEIAGVERVSG
jgi:PAS domain S-box-containing protein